MENIVQIILAIIGSGVLTSIVTHLLSTRKYKAEVDELRQQIEAARTDNQIKIDDHIKKQLLEISENYKAEMELSKHELEELRRQNKELITQVNDNCRQITDLNVKIHQLMSWVTYDMLSYQKWLEKELTAIRPDIKLPGYRKPPKFVQDFIDEELTRHEQQHQDEPSTETSSETE